MFIPSGKAGNASKPHLESDILPLRFESFEPRTSPTSRVCVVANGPMHNFRDGVIQHGLVHPHLFLFLKSTRQNCVVSSRTGDQVRTWARSWQSKCALMAFDMEFKIGGEARLTHRRRAEATNPVPE